jgi:hypothetical protein
VGRSDKRIVSDVLSLCEAYVAGSVGNGASEEGMRVKVVAGLGGRGCC